MPEGLDIGYEFSRERFRSVKADYKKGLVTEEQLKIARRRINREKNWMYAHPGYIYVIKVENGFCKIGKAQDIRKRLSELYFMLPVPYKLVGLLKFEASLDAESYFHEKFASKRVKGEWFKLTSRDIRYFRRLKGDMKLDV